MPSIVCLHGLRRTPSDWDGVRAGLEPYGSVRTPVVPGVPAQALVCADADVGDGDVVIGHSIGGVVALRLARERRRALRAIVLTSCFFPPARNGRSLASSVGDYAGHRVAFARTARAAGDRERSAGSARALAMLVRQAVQRDGHAAIDAPVLVVHARDDHHVPVDFALAAAARQGWDSAILDRGGHHAHVDAPERWLDAVTPWLSRVAG